MSILNENLTEVSLHRGKQHTPSPLKNQMSRSSLLSSNGSNRLNVSVVTNQYIVPLNKTPQNLTPSQRLKLRKNQVNSSIAKLKTSDVVMEDDVLLDDLDCDEIDDVMVLPNSSTSSTSSTTSTRPGSVFSHDGLELARLYNSSSSLFSNSLTSFSEDLVVAKNTEEPLSSMVLFNNSEYLQIFEETRQRRRLLSAFTKQESLDILTVDQSNEISPESKISHAGSHASGIIQTSEAKDHIKMQTRVHIHEVSSSIQLTTPIHAKEQESEISKSLPRNIRSASTPAIVSQAHKKLTQSPSLQPRSHSLLIPPRYYSFTRPIWLPPKPSQEKLKHHKEAEGLTKRAISTESKQVRAKISRLENMTKLKSRDMEVWQDLLNTINHLEFSQKLELVNSSIWSRGIPLELRPQIWWKYFNSPASLKQFELKCFDDQPQRLLQRISNDVKDPLLVKVIAAFVIQMSKIDTTQDVLNFYTPQLNPVVAMFLAAYRNIYKAFVSVCYVYSNTPILRELLAKSEATGSTSIKNFIKRYEQEFERKIPQLAAHFNYIGFSALDYLPKVALGLLLNQLNVRLNCHIMDIFLFGKLKDEEFISTLLIGYCLTIQYKLFGSKEEVLGKIVGRTYIGTDYEFIEQLQ